MAEHRPHGPTEEHLVEEIAGILWRKRRLCLAEERLDNGPVFVGVFPWQHRVARQHAVAQRVEAGDVGAAGLGRQGLWRCCRRPYPRFNSGAPCCAAEAFHEVHQAHGRPFLGGVMGSAPPFVGRPVHEPWPGGKLPEWPVQFLF